jgi:hypothetical protein
MTKIEYPPLAGPDDPAWWTPLKGAIQSIGGVHRSYRLLPSDFMYMYRAVRRERPDISAYQHRWTRHYLHLDAEGRPYRFVAAAHPAQGPGRYLRYRNLAAALDRLALWNVPSSRLEEAARHDTCGGMALTDAEEGSDGRLHLV